MDNTSKYLPQLLEWVSDKIVFWQSELGSNLVQGTSKNVGVKHSLVVTSNPGKRSYSNQRYNNSQGGKNNDKANNQLNRPYTDKLGCLFCMGGRGHDSLFDCEKFKNAGMTNRCRFITSYRLCWRCLERGHVALQCPNKKIKACDKYLHCEIACTCDYRGKKMISATVSDNRAFHSISSESKGVRLPILPVNIYTPRVKREFMPS